MNNCSNSDNISNKLNFYVDIDCLRKFCGIYILYTFSLFITNTTYSYVNNEFGPKNNLSVDQIKEKLRLFQAAMAGVQVIFFT